MEVNWRPPANGKENGQWALGTATSQGMYVRMIVCMIGADGTSRVWTAKRPVAAVLALWAAGWGRHGPFRSACCGAIGTQRPAGSHSITRRVCVAWLARQAWAAQLLDPGPGQRTKKMHSGPVCTQSPVARRFRPHGRRRDGWCR